MEKYERLKYLRKDILKMTQQQFADMIGISRSNLGNIEVNTIALTERNAKDICEKFHVNEKWLLNGEGEIIEQRNESEEIADFLAQLLKGEKDDEFKCRFISALSRMDESGWNALEQFLDDFNEK